MNHSIKITQNLNEFTQTLNGFCSKHNYSTFYMSIGSKQNEENTYFSYPDCIRDQRVTTNAGNQMFPGYLRSFFKERRGLIVVIDDFRCSKSKAINSQLLNDILQSSNRNIDIIMMNSLVNVSSLQEIIRATLTCLEYQHIDTLSYLFANFIRFRNLPNETEFHLEENIPTAIQNVLNREYEGKYKNCFYQWYGYTYYQYNYLYCYKTYHMLRMMRATQLLCLFKDNMNTSQLSPENIYLMNSQMEINPCRNSRHIWREFCIHSKTIL